MSVGIYIHYPFCERLCFYCNFYKEGYKTEKESFFLKNIIKEIKIKREKYQNQKIDSIFVGGGSPSMAKIDTLSKIINELDRNFLITNNCEISIESNPNELLNLKKNIEIKKIGFNRISIGVQSYSAKGLNFFNRNYNTKQVKKAFLNCQKAGFENINCDFIIGAYKEEKKDIQSTLNFIKQYNPAHLSFYLFEYKKKKIEEEEEEFNYNNTKEKLISMGYNQYEISNFSIDGFECQHNLKYWKNKPYLAFGPGASQYFNGYDTKNRENLLEYAQLINENQEPIKEKTKWDKKKRALIMGLRLRQGIKENDFFEYKKKLEELKKLNLLSYNNGYYQIKEEKILLTNEIIGYLI